MKLAFLLPVFWFGGNPLDTARLEAIHAQRVEWMKTRISTPPQGVYNDYRAVAASGNLDRLVKSARETEVRVLFVETTAPEVRNGILIVPKPAQLPHFEESPRSIDAKKRELESRFKEFPDEVFDIAGFAVADEDEPVAFRRTSVHILARSLNDVPNNLHRAYVAHDWLCDPSGFTFVAENSYGSYDIGDTVPIMKGTRLLVNLPIAGSIRILRGDEVVAEKAARQMEYPVTEQGSYRAEVDLRINGETRPWIRTNPIEIGKPSLMLPVGQMSPGVEVRRDIAYVDDAIAKHKLDLYLPKGKKNFPMMVFYHGGAWKSGDRSLYPLLGNRFAKAGIGVAVPSYRLMPENPHPAQIEDAAAAFAWIYRNIEQIGADASKIYVAGHSAGGHLAALLALDPEWLKKYDISPGAIRGVASLSGVYNVSEMREFKNANASPIQFVHPRTPPFLITYCQWDYLGLPKQARDFAAALRKEFDEVRLVYIPGESHISEIISALKDDDPTALALLDFVK